VELAQLVGGPLGGFQLGVEAGQVAELQQVGAAQAAAAQRHRPVADPLGEADHLGGGGQPLAGHLGLLGAPDGQVAVVQHGGERGRIAQAPGQLDGLLAQRQPALDLGREQQRLGQPGEHPCPQRAVGPAEGGERVLQQRDLDPVDDPGGELQPEAEAGPGEHLRRADPPGQLPGLLVGGAGGRHVAGGHPGLADGQQQLAALALAGPLGQVEGCQRAFEEVGGFLPGEQVQGASPGQGGRPHRPRHLAAGGRGDEVVGQLGQVWPRVGRVEVFQRLPGTPVQADPAGGGQPLVEHLADQRMGEAPAAEPAGDLGDHPGRLGLLEQLEQAVAAQAADRLEGA
jgi:hypothetical protein